MSGELYGRIDDDGEWLYRRPNSVEDALRAEAVGALWGWDGELWIVTDVPIKRFEVLVERPDAILVNHCDGAPLFGADPC